MLGPCDGHVGALVDKVTAISSRHGPFAAAFLVGDLFGDGSGADEQRLLDGELVLPMPTYFFYGARALPERVAARLGTPHGASSVEIARNLHYLGSAGVVDVQGFHIAFCGGAPHMAPRSDAPAASAHVWAPLDTPESLGSAVHMLEQHPDLALGDAALAAAEPTTLAEARALAAQKDQREEMLRNDAAALSRRRRLDFLFTTAWPLGIDAFSSVALPDGAHALGSGAVTRLAERARPRYHFSAGAGSGGGSGPGVFWEREPYENPPFAMVSAPPSITRFVSLARAANPEKVRWFMALNLVPAADLDPGLHASAFARPSNVTLSPVLPRPKRGPVGEGGGAGGGGVRFADAPAEKRRRPARRREAAAPVSPEQCWFCLSNPRVEKYLIVAIGEECYLAFPKGQLPVSTDAATPVPGGGHVLIIPIAHIPSVYGPGGGALRAEMRRWRDALAACYAAFDAVAVSWETVKRVGTRASHVQAQVVPVPRARAAGLVACFCEAAAADGLAFEKDEVVDAFDACDARRDEDVGLVPEGRDEFIRLEVDGHVLLALPRGARFNLQFARETLAAYLGMPERGDWRACTRAPDAEAAEVEEFKRVFDAYALE